jgi:hypothetical protein
MGVCASICSKAERHDGIGRFPAVGTKESPDGELEKPLKAQPASGKEDAPLLTGPTLLSFSNIRLSGSSSSSVELDLNELEQMLPHSAGDPEPKKSPEEVDGTFRDVRPDLNLNELSSGSQGDDVQ